LLLAAAKALGLSLGKRDVDPGRVLYFAGENPDDVRMRWIALSEKMDFDPNTIDVHFLEGTFKISELIGRIKRWRWQRTSGFQWSGLHPSWGGRRTPGSRTSPRCSALLTG
jgi:hypothetical protein